MATDAEALLRGLLLGFSIAAPVGPIGVLCIRRTLAEGRLIGFLSGLGAATADGFYGAVAAFGLTALASLLLSINGPLRLVGGAFLLYLGLRTFRAPVAAVPIESTEGSDRDAAPGGGRARAYGSAYSSTVLLTITNPLTILSFAGMYAGLGAAGGAAPGALVAGTFLGSAAWWLVLTTGVSLLRGRLTSGALRWVNRLSGLFIIAFGLSTLIGLLRG